MNRPIRRVALVCFVLFTVLMLNVTYNVVVRQSSLNADARNRRVRDAEFAQDRGPILAGQVQIARTEPSDGQFAFQRVYDQPYLYAPITGYYSYDHGSTALEAKYSSKLAGTDDSQFVRRVLDVATGEKPKGASVETTIVPAAQEAAFAGLDGKKGAVVASDPKTGAILAMVTTPSFDPNTIGSHDLSASNKAYARLADDPARPLSNRATREIYPPGSVFKLVTASAALENGRPVDQPVDSPAQLTLPGTQAQLGNDAPCGGSQVTMEQALAVSCNTAFANLALEVGPDKMRDQSEKFGFGTQPLTDLNAVASRYPDEMNDAQLAMTGIGQYDVAATPLQINMVTSAIANHGQLYRPYVVETVRASNLSPIETHRPDLMGKPLSGENADALASMMETVVDEGTGTNAQISGVDVGGKTSTAQSDPSRPPYALFTSFARNDDGEPVVAVTVFVEDAGVDRSQVSGGGLAAPIARDVMESLL